MNGDRVSDESLEPESIDYALRLARAVDPTCGEASIHGFLHEIREASEALAGIDVAAAPSVTAFSAAWPDENAS